MVFLEGGVDFGAVQRKARMNMLVAEPAVSHAAVPSVRWGNLYHSTPSHTCYE